MSASEHIDSIISEYQSGESISAIRRITGAGHDTVKHILVNAGVPIRTRSEAMRIFQKNLRPCADKQK